MLFSYDWLQSLIKGKLLKVEKLAEFLTMHIFEVENIQKSGQGRVLDISVLPNRGSDCFSHLGIAREIAAILNLKLEVPAFKIKEDGKFKTRESLALEIRNNNGCSRYNARVIRNVKVKSSPHWLKQRLKAVGLRPVNNIVDITNYVMLETGQPLHAFDWEKLSGGNLKKIIVRKAKKGEKIISLDDESYDLNEDMLVIADSKDILAIAGIKGGKKAEITPKTKTIVLESANFDRMLIRRASKKLNLKTDASLRFEHGLDPNLTEFAINRAAYLIQKIGGGKPSQGLLDFYPEKVLPKLIDFDLNYAYSMLGIIIPKEEIIRIFRNLGFQFKLAGGKILVQVPTFRLDILFPEDLIEEAGRLYGYEKIPPVFPMAALIPPKRNFDVFWEEMTKDILKEAGFSEAYNYSFLSKKEVEVLELKNQSAEVENPTSADFQYLRPSLIFHILKNIKENQKFFKEIKIFELGKIFMKTDSKVEEKRMLTGAISGEAFFQAKGVVDSLFQKLGISNVWYDDYQVAPENSRLSIWHPLKCAEIKTDGEKIGFLGEIALKTLTDYFKIEGRVVVFDIDFDKLTILASEKHEYNPISPFPSAVRDLALLVPGDVRVENVLNIIETTGGKLVVDVDLFDIYEGEELPEGKKNLAFHVIYQSDDRTLTSKEIDEIQQKIAEALEADPEWEVRK